VGHCIIALVDAAHAARAWLASDAARELPRALRAELETALAGSAGGSCLTLPHGTIACALARRGGLRRALEIDRRGTAVTALLWHDDGRLGLASVRMPDRSCVTIEPRASTGAPWGLSDRLWHTPRLGQLDGGEALSVFGALDYARVTAIPPLAEPSRLPPGAGTAVLNLVASLARDQGRERLSYAGPWATEALFLALLESFRYEPAVPDPLAAFAAGELAWRPAPHERVFEAGGVYVQLRGRVDKVVWEGRTYYRPDWQSLRRHAPRRVRDVGDAVHCGLWALDGALEDHLRLTADGELRAVVAPPSAPSPPRTLPSEVVRGIVDRVVGDAAPALAPWIRASAAGLGLAWGPVEHDLIRVEGPRAWMSARLRDRAAARLRGCRRGQALAVGAALLGELAALLGDALRARAQALLATRPAEEQEAVLDRAADPEAAEAAARMRAAAELLAAELGAVARPGSARRAEDQPDVEGDEQEDGEG
jgi:hypothetical protein